MWTLLKDSARRNGMVLFCACLISWLLTPFFIGMSVEPQYRRLYTDILIFYFIMCSAGYHTVAMRSDMAALRVWRSLPFRAATLSTYLWFLAVLLIPAIALVMTTVSWLPFRYGLGLFRHGANAGIDRAFLFPFLGILYSGLACFLGVSYQWTLTCITDGRGVKARRYVWLRFFIGGATALCALIQLLAPPPLAWSPIPVAYAACAALAIGLTTASFFLRAHLLRVAPARESYAALSAKEAPLPRSSCLAMLAKEWKTAAAKGILAVFILSGYYLYLDRHAGAWPSHWMEEITRFLSQMMPAILLYGFPVAISAQRRRATAVRVFRSLPLTSGRCALLYLSYPFAALLGVLSCTAIASCVVSADQTLYLSVAGVLISAALCPPVMIVLLRFGTRAIPWILFAAVIGAMLVLPSILHPDLLARLVSVRGLCASALVVACLSFAGFYSLRRLLETNSAIYHRKTSPEQSG